MAEAPIQYNVPRGTAYLTGQQVIVYASSFLFYVLVFRILNLAEIGQISLLSAILAVFNTLTQLALPAAATRFISSNLGIRDSSAASAVAKTSLRLLLTIATPLLILGLLFSPLIGSLVFNTPNATLLVIITLLAGFILDLTTLYGAYFLGLGQYAKTVYQNVLYVPLSRGLGLALAYTGLRVEGVVLGWAIGALATLLLSLQLWRHQLPRATSSPTRPLLTFSLPLFASALITLIQGWGDIALLQVILGQFATTGAYYIIVSSVGFLTILYIPVASALYPALSANYSSRGPQQVSEKLGLVLRLVNLTILPSTAALAAVAPTALAVVYGPRLVVEAVPFAILLLTTVFSAQALLLFTTLQAIRNTRPIFTITLAATIIDLAIVTIFGRTLGTTAGAIGRAILAITTLLLAVKALRKKLDVPIRRGLSKALLLALGISIPLALADQLLTHTIPIQPLLRLPILLTLFTASLSLLSRRLQIFQTRDFALLEKTLPTSLQPVLVVIQRLFMS